MRFLCHLLVATCCIGIGSNMSRADLVFGNLGAAGTNALDGVDSATITSQFWVGQGFVVGGANTYLESVTVGLYDDDASTARVALYEDDAGLLATSTAVVSGTTPTLQTFNFGYQLTSGINYWIVVEAASGQFNWAFNQADDFGTAQNASGWTPHLPDQTIKTVNAGGDGFSQANELRPTSFSVNATVPVPEPSACMMALAGLACGGYSMWRRRKRA